MNYISGSHSFLASHLLKKIEATSIPHKDLASIKLKPFNNLYFLSSYGNMSTHTDEDKIFQANVMDLIHILIEAKKHPFKSFVFISTSSVKLSIQTVYSRTKKAAEEILLSMMERQYPIIVIRPFSITGVGEQKEHLIPTLIRSCLKGELVNFVREPTHDWIDVDDVVDGILTLSEKNAKGIFELGTGISTTNQQVLEMVEKVTGKKANINIVPSLRAYDTNRWVSANFRARGYGWSVKKTLLQSITEQVKTYGKT